MSEWVCERSPLRRQESSFVFPLLISVEYRLLGCHLLSTVNFWKSTLLGDPSGVSAGEGGRLFDEDATARFGAAFFGVCRVQGSGFGVQCWGGC